MLLKADQMSKWSHLITILCLHEESSNKVVTILQDINNQSHIYFHILH